MSQNITLSAKDRADIEKIKPMIMDNKTQLDMSLALNLRRETVNRKIQRWVQTPDFEIWLKTAWLVKYQTVDDKTAFDALTKLLGKMVTHKTEVKQDIDIHEKTEVILLDDFSEDEKAFLTLVARKYIKAGNKGGPASIH